MYINMKRLRIGYDIQNDKYSIMYIQMYIYDYKVVTNRGCLSHHRVGYIVYRQMEREKPS